MFYSQEQAVILKESQGLMISEDCFKHNFLQGNKNNFNDKPTLKTPFFPELKLKKK